MKIAKFAHLTTTLLTLGLLTLAGCTSEASSTPEPKELRFSVIPDFNKTKLAESAAVLETFLTKKLGVPVHYVASNDYTMSVNSLVNNTTDFVWLGGKTACDALDAGKGQVRLIASRDIDLHFQSYFIANKAAIDAGKVKKLDKLTDLKPLAKDLTFTFGDKNSTSGHLMPRYFLSEAGIDPAKDFKAPAGCAISGGHGTTLKNVVSGAVDMGALNFSTYNNASAEEKAKAPIVFTTPEFVDYVWVAHTRIGDSMMKKLTAAFIDLDMKNPDDKKVLDAWSAKERFIAPDAKLWDSIRKVRDSLGADFFK